MPPSSISPLVTDLYQLTMAAGYFHRGFAEHIATCEAFVRRLPTTRRFLVALGVDAILDTIEGLRFSDEDVAFLKTVPALASAMTDDFCAYLRAFRFTGEVWAVEEGTLVFDNEPILRVRAPIIQAQLLETVLLSTINHATMIGSKAARMVIAAEGRALVEFGTRRTHPDAAVDAARAAYAVGFAGTSNVEASRRFGVPVSGTAAHMWTMAHASEEEAFRSYVSVFPKTSILLVDTYDTVRGALRAARVAGEDLVGVRLDSGDLDALSRQVRAVLDREGAPRAKIVASGDLNEHSISRLVASGAPIDTFGVGTELVCSVDAPSLGGVYKLVEIDDGSGPRGICKFSEGKATMPGAHQVLRVTDDGLYEHDIIVLDHEDTPTLASSDQGVTALLSKAFEDGQRVRASSPLTEVRARVAAGLSALPLSVRSLAPRGPSEVGYAVVPSAAILGLTEDVRARVGVS